MIPTVSCIEHGSKNRRGGLGDLRVKNKEVLCHAAREKNPKLLSTPAGSWWDVTFEYWLSYEACRHCFVHFMVVICHEACRHYSLFHGCNQFSHEACRLVHLAPKCFLVLPWGLPQGLRSIHSSSTTPDTDNGYLIGMAVPHALSASYVAISFLVIFHLGFIVLYSLAVCAMVLPWFRVTFLVQWKFLANNELSCNWNSLCNCIFLPKGGGTQLYSCVTRWTLKTFMHYGLTLG